MVVNNNYLNNINRINGSHTVPQERKQVQNAGSFENLLQEKISRTGSLKFSKHAEYRLQARSIRLSSDQLQKINEAVDRAEEKGVKDTLVLMDGLAFVVNVKSKTVITAVNSGELKENVFTNIDGAVFAK
jgi:flagellar operon protein